MPMLCTTCMQKKPSTEFYVAAISRFMARCATCRAVDEAMKETPPRSVYPIEKRKAVETVNTPPKSNIRLIPDAGLARDLAFVFSQQLGVPDARGR